MDFIQPAAELGNQYRDDRALRSWLERALPASVRTAIEPDLAELGEHAVEAWREARSRSPGEPHLTRWDAWGRRIDRIEITPVWQQGRQMSARYGLVAAGHDGTHGIHARSDQFARAYLYHVASEFYTCPLAMTDGAATALKASGNHALINRAVPHLTSRDASTLWLSGQWMTEAAGGSDVGRTATIARRDEAGRWRLTGRKWFTSAVIGEMALTLARPEGAGGGADALALFHVETHDADGNWNGVRVERLKDKLGTRELPTAEIQLEGAIAEPVGALDHGVRLIAPMLNVTRTWNAVGALATMRRSIALAGDYALRRNVFGRALIDQPLHAATLADMQAEFEAAFHLVFFVTELLGRSEHGSASADEVILLRLLTPLAKLWTGKLAVTIAAETCEAFGGAGYIENTGIPQLARDAQVFPIWEGTTNVLALDVLRVLSGAGLDAALRAMAGVIDETGTDAAAPARSVLDTVRIWLDQRAGDRTALELGARGLALTLARSFAALLLARHAAWARREQVDAHADAAFNVFARHGLTRLETHDAAETALLARA
ncbi:MAG: acyl-CoA dehydrogenase family protein [Rhodanobacteraceae bacterium]